MEISFDLIFVLQNFKEKKDKIKQRHKYSLYILHFNRIISQPIYIYISYDWIIKYRQNIIHENYLRENISTEDRRNWGFVLKRKKERNDGGRRKKQKQKRKRTNKSSRRELFQLSLVCQLIGAEKLFDIKQTHGGGVVNFDSWDGVVEKNIPRGLLASSVKSNRA